MMIPSGITRAFAVSEQSGPKTVLAFCGTVLAITAALTLGLIIALASLGHVVLASVVLAGCFAIFVGIITWVLAAMQKDPSRLVVGPMSGREFLEYQRWTAGDDIAGETVETLNQPPGHVIEGRAYQQLPAAPNEAADE